MNRIIGPAMGRALALVVIAVAVGACSLLAPPVALRTEQVKSDACMDALITGTLARHAQSGLGIRSEDGASIPVTWPFGYTARAEAGRIVLLDQTGKVVAREGDQVRMGGGMGQFEVWYACAPVEVIAPPG